MDNEINDWTNSVVMASELDEDWFTSMADLIVARCDKSFAASDRSIIDKYKEAMVKGVDENGNHLDLVALNEMKPNEIVNALRNINNHRSRATNVISQLEDVEFFTPFTEVEVAVKS